MEDNNHLKIVKSSNDDSDKNKSKERPLNFDELMAEIETKGTVQEREQCVVDNLRRKGLI